MDNLTHSLVGALLGRGFGWWHAFFGDRNYSHRANVAKWPMDHVQDGHTYLTDQRFFDAGRPSSSTFLIRLDKARPSS